MPNNSARWFPTRRRKSRASLPPARTATLAGLVAAACAAALFARHRLAETRSGSRKWSCECGQRYVVRGTDRHRVYWLPDAGQDDPVLGRDCVNCGTPLPAGHDSALV